MDHGRSLYENHFCTSASFSLLFDLSILQTTDYGHPERVSFESQTYGPGVQIGLIFFEGFRVFSAELAIRL